jgi:flagellar motor switch protein FliN
MPVLTAPSAATSTPGSEELNRILRIHVPVIVKLAQRKIGVQEVLRIGLGSIIEFHKPADEPLDLMINNKTIGQGIAVKVGENFGLKLTAVGDPKALIGAMSS